MGSDALFSVRRSQNLQDGRKTINPACIACGADRNTTDTLTRVLGTSLVWGVLRGGAPSMSETYTLQYLGACDV